MMLFLILAYLFISAILLSTGSALDPTRLIYDFPKGTWIENLAVRPCGSILLNILTSPDLYLINPLAPNSKPTFIHNFPSGLGLNRITETYSDTFYVVLSNLSLSTLSTPPDSTQIFRVYFPQHQPNGPPEISLAATIPYAIFPNGLITLQPTTLLLSDSTKGVIYAIDTRTGSSRIAIDDPLFKGTDAKPQLGINGIKLLGNFLYFTNTARARFGKVPIDVTTGSALGPAAEISVAASGTAYDDVALSRLRDAAFLATGGGDCVAEVNLRTGKTIIVAGQENTTTIAQPTSAQFGRTSFDREVLYVVTSGGLAIPIDGAIVVGGQVVAVDTRRQKI